MDKWKKEYEEIVVPANIKEKVEEAVMRAKNEKKRVHKHRIIKIVGSMAAVLAIALILPNTSQTAAAAMQQIPILGGFFRVVTIREYHVDEERQSADVKIPQVEPDETAGASDEIAEQAQQSAEEINIDIQKITDEMVEEFKKSMEEYEEGYQDLYIDSRVLVDDEKWFSLELILYQGAGSGYERHRHYTIDKTTGKRAALQDFYGDQYVETISEQVKEEMHSRMEADESVIYWLDNEEIPEWNFQQINEDQDFYVDADGNVVICFDEYEVAPGYMGCVEFPVKVPDGV